MLCRIRVRDLSISFFIDVSWDYKKAIEESLRNIILFPSLENGLPDDVEAREVCILDNLRRKRYVFDVINLNDLAIKLMNIAKLQREYMKNEGGEKGGRRKAKTSNG